MKPNGKVRLCLDPKPLNKALKSNHYPIPTIDDLLSELCKALVFSVVDVKNGFWLVQLCYSPWHTLCSREKLCFVKVPNKLDDESSKLTTFATPWDRFRWLRMPFGIDPAPEEFQRRLNQALEGLHGVRTITDDIIVYGVGDTENDAVVDHDRKFLALL